MTPQPTQPKAYPTVKRRLGEMLLEAGVITQAQLNAALDYQRKSRMKIGNILVCLQLVDEAHVLKALSHKLGVEVLDLDKLQRGPELDEALALVPRQMAVRHLLLPVACSHTTVTVAMADPFDLAVIDELSFRTGRRVQAGIAGMRPLSAAIRRLYGELQVSPAELKATGNREREAVVAPDRKRQAVAIGRKGTWSPS